MNWKQVLYKGLPIFIIAAILIVVALIAGRPDPKPIVKPEDEKVVNFKGLKVTRGELYEMMKEYSGRSTLLDIIDRDLLKAYENLTPELLEALDKEIQEAKDKNGEELFLESMINNGVILSKDDPQAETKIKNYYILDYMKEAFARDEAINELRPEDGEDLIDKAMNEYEEDMCVISLKFSTKAKALEAADDLINLTGTALVNKFDEIWKEQNPNGAVDPYKNEEVPTFISSYECQYNRIVYEKQDKEYRDFVYGNTYKETDANGNTVEKPFTIGTYNKMPKVIGSYNYIIYKVSQAPDKSTYNQEQFETYITDQLIEGKVTDEYIKQQLNDLRRAHKITIYDPELAEQYKNLDSKFKGQTKLRDKYTVAKYVSNDKTIYITANNLYDEMKTQDAVYSLLERINYAALKTISGIKLTKEDKKDVEEKVEAVKTDYFQKGYNQYWSYPDYVLMAYGAYSIEDLYDQFASEALAKRYILGYKEYTGVEQITEADIDKAYADWFSIEASHILFTFDPSATEDTDTQRTKATAKLMAEQVIRGCTETEIENETCYIEYNYPNDNETDPVPFKGLDLVEIKDYKTVLSALAKVYSDEDGADQSGGSLGYFGPGKMVPKFEDAAKAIAARGKNNYSQEPVETKIPTQDGTIYGFHVILVTNVKEKTTQPTTEQAADKTNPITVAYNNFRATLKTGLEEERTEAGNKAKLLAELREELEFAFKDEAINNHYEAIHNLQVTYDRDKYFE